MCTPEKKALIWSTYLNAQYQALWKIADTCDDSDEENCRFYRAFATFDYFASGDSPNAQDTPDIVTFDEPKLVFICNHAVILTLSVKEGSLTNISTEDSGPQAKITLSGEQASFRMSFTRTHVTGRDSKIDDQAADHEVRMVVFEFEKATLVTEHELAVGDFFRAYLQFLRLAGHHVLFGFPDFTDKKVLESLPVDYAILARNDEELEEFCREITYFNLSITQINDYIQFTQYERAEARAQEKKEALVASIVKVRWTKEATVIFDIKFGVPVVKALCPHEILFVFTLDEITQLENFELLTKSVTVAFVVNVSEFDGKTLKVDFRTARYTGTSSSIYTYEFFSDSIDAQSIVEYLSTEYMDILTKFNYNVIFGPQEEKPRSALKDDGFWRRVHNVTDFLAVRRYGESAIWIDRSQHVSLAGVYQAFALSEQALDEILRTKWLNESYNVWDQEAFKATFSSFSIRLLSTDRLIIIVEIEQAEIISGHAHSKQRPGKGPPLRIFQARRGYSAAELQARIEEEQRESYKGTMVFEVGLEFTELDLEAADVEPAFDLELSLSHAEFIEGLSNLQEYKTGLKASDSAQATVRRFMQQYFNDLHTQKRLTVGTVLSRIAGQTFAFQTICEREVKIENFLTTRSEASDSSIIVLVSRRRHDPAPSLPWSPGWLPSRLVGGVGTVWIAREEFLQKLLDTLEVFNARTTIVRGTDDTFTTFHTRHTGNGNTERTHWQRESIGDLANEYMEYTWHYTYDANRREGTLLTQDLEALLLRTQNQVWVPTESSSKTNQVELALTGEHHTEAAKKQKYGHQLLKKDTMIWWELIITVMATTEDGLRISVSHETNFNVDGDDAIKDTFDAEKLLSMQVVVKDLEDELRRQMQGPWVYNWLDLDTNVYEVTNPIFTRSGDLVFEVYRKGSMEQISAVGGFTEAGTGLPADTSGLSGLNHSMRAEMSGSQTSFVASATSTARQSFSTTTTTQSVTRGATTTRR